MLCCAARYTEQAQAEEQKLAKKNKARLDDEVGTWLHHSLTCAYHAPLPLPATWPQKPGTQDPSRTPSLM